MEYAIKIYYSISGDLYTQFILNNIVKNKLIFLIESEINNMNTNVECILYYDGLLIYDNDILEFIYNKLLEDQLLELTIYIINKDIHIINYLENNIYTQEFFDSKYKNLLSKYIYIKKDIGLNNYLLSGISEYDYTLDYTKLDDTLNFIPEELQDNEDSILNASCSYSIRYASDRLKNNKKFVLKYINKSNKNDIYELNYISNRLKNDYDVMLQSINKNPTNIIYASDKLKDNDKFMLQTINEWYNSLEYASDRLKDDDKFMFQSINKSYNSLKYASDRLKDDFIFILSGIKCTGLILKYASNRLKDNDIIVLEAVTNNGNALKYASNRLKDNLDIVVAAIINNNSALNYASDRLQNDFNIN